jgi:hypothetical protein
VRSSYGSHRDQVGRYRNETGEFTPQGFVVTPAGQLLVLDTGKKRLLWYGPKGDLQREESLPVDAVQMPADVAASKDGSIVVLDHLKDLLVLDARGRYRASLPNTHGGFTGMYLVGDDIMLTVDGTTTRSAGHLSGAPGNRTQDVQVGEDGLIAGHLAPDGTTVLSVGLEDTSRGDFWVRAVRGAAGQEVLTRSFRAPGVTGVPLIQADAHGRVYLVVNSATSFSLVCLDGATGSPVGRVELPVADGLGGTQFRLFNVAPNGGVVYQLASPRGVSFEWFNCHP